MRKLVRILGFSLIPAVYRDLKIYILVAQIRRFFFKKIQPIINISSGSPRVYYFFINYWFTGPINLYRCLS